MYGTGQHPYRDETRHAKRSFRGFFRRLAQLLIVLAIVGGLAFLYFHWPRLKVVETGHSLEYSDLKPRQYDKSPTDTAQATKAIFERLGWKYLGSGSGKGGGEVRAIVHPYHLPVTCQVIVHIKGAGERSTVSVRSESEYGPWDFGQNARNIRAFLAEMDVEME
jgi:hypothetical protein